MKKTIMVRQGDVLLVAREKIPEGVYLEEGCILAHGEATGHAHEIKEGAKIWVDINNLEKRYLEILADKVVLQHQEHTHIELFRDSSTIYEIIRQREYNPQEVRHVQD